MASVYPIGMNILGPVEDGRYNSVQYVQINPLGGITVFNKKLELEQGVNTNEEHFRINELGYVFSSVKKALKYCEDYMEVHTHMMKLTITGIKPLKLVKRQTQPVIVEDIK